jgi:superfamily II DNA/RNA helicase
VTAEEDASDGQASTSAAPVEVTPVQHGFAELGVAPAIVAALAEHNIFAPFPIQEMAIPLALTGTDLIAQARTGTGKTFAFAAPLLQRTVMASDPEAVELAAPGKPQALVVAPTRELAVQVSEDVSVAGAKRNARILTVYGGTSYEPQLDALAAGVDVVVGTPGRLIDLMNRRALDLSHVKILVLDEADRMLDLGFAEDVEKLIAATSPLRQTMLFSATMPADIVKLARRHLRHPVNIRAESTEEGQTVPATAQFVYQAHDLDKPELVARILQAENHGRTIVFCPTKRQCQRLSDDLRERGFDAASIHGDLTQVAREKNLERFRGDKIDVLVATDVAARGIDVEAVTHVINYACPEDEKAYLHRIGRTGRAGASGIAVTLVDWADLPRWRSINKMLGLPFEDPPETYSTSEHLFHDMGIPTGSRGRLSAPASSEADAEMLPGHGSDRRAGPGGGRDGRGGGRTQGGGRGSDRGRTDRNGSTRNGSGRTASTGSSDRNGSARSRDTSARPAAAEAAEVADRPAGGKRPRRRTRGGGRSTATAD